MKPLAPLTLLTLAALSNLNASELIRHTQIGTGLTWDYYPSSSEGKMRSPLPCGPQGSTLTSYSSRGNTGGKLTSINTTSIGAGLPSARIQIISEDPHYPPRTRADRPFTVKISQSNRNSNLHLSRETRAYQPKLHALSLENSSFQRTAWKLPIGANHQGVFYSALAHSDSTRNEGIERFTVSATANDGNLRPLQSESIQVWPVASAQFHGIVQGTTYTEKKLPASSVIYTNAYPSSTTYVHIYQGSAKLGRIGTVMPLTVLRYNSPVPQTQKLLLGEWADTLLDGTYTLEVLTVTPFFQGAPERLAAITVHLNRGIHSPSVVDGGKSSK